MFLKIGLCFIVLRFIEINAVEINCEYSVDGYICKADTLEIDSLNQKIIKVSANHAFEKFEIFHAHGSPKLTYLPIGLNEHFTQLKKLDVQLTSLKYISKENFFGLELLKIIDFNGNQIEIIPSDVFSTLTNLEHLSLSKNKITKLFSSTFENLHKLQELYLQDNQIDELDENLFINNSELKIISLSRNRLKTIGSKLVSQLFKLTKIEFSGDKNCIQNNYDLTTDISSSLLTIDNALQASCSKTDKVSIDTIDEFKSSLLNLDTQISSLQFERKNLITGLLNEKQKEKAEILKLQKKIEELTNFLNESEERHKVSTQFMEKEIKKLKTSNQELIDQKEIDKIAILELQEKLENMTISSNESEESHTVTTQIMENEINELKTLNQVLIHQKENDETAILVIQEKLENVTISSQESEKLHKILLHNMENENNVLDELNLNLKKTVYKLRFELLPKQLENNIVKNDDEKKKFLEDVKTQLNDMNIQMISFEKHQNNLKHNLTEMSNSNKLLEADKIDLVAKLNENDKVIDEHKKSLEDVQKQLNDIQIENNNLSQEVLSQNNSFFNMINEMNQESQKYHNTIQMLKDDSIKNMTLLDNKINELKPCEQSLHQTTETPEDGNDNRAIATKFTVIFTFVMNHKEETLLLCSGSFNIFLIIILLLLLRSTKSGVVQNIETTLVMTEKRSSVNYY